MKAACGDLLTCYGYLILNTTTSDTSVRICDRNVSDLLLISYLTFFFYKGESNGNFEA